MRGSRSVFGRPNGNVPKCSPIGSERSLLRRRTYRAPADHRWANATSLGGRTQSRHVDNQGEAESRWAIDERSRRDRADEVEETVTLDQNLRRIRVVVAHQANSVCGVDSIEEVERVRRRRRCLSHLDHRNQIQGGVVACEVEMESIMLHRVTQFQVDVLERYREARQPTGRVMVFPAAVRRVPGRNAA